MESFNFKILSASAGTGKTYRLAKAYLTLLLRPEGMQNFRDLLAITFTNKAVGEMRQRILSNLHAFAYDNFAENENTLFSEVAADLKLSSDQLNARSKLVLKQLLHNYAFFDITTIDGFNHKLIRTFARDLKISQNFEVELDTNFILDQSVSMVLRKAGTDEKLTNLLVDFSLEKIENDKSWDVAHNLLKIGELIFNENHHRHLNGIKSKSTADFLKLKEELGLKRDSAKELLITSAEECLKKIHSFELEFSDFNRSYFPKFLEQIKNSPGEINFDAKWKQNFGDEPLHNKSTPELAKNKIDQLMPFFEENFIVIKESFLQSAFLERCEKLIVPLSLLAEIIKAFETLKQEHGFLTIPEFNQLIAKELKKQPIPYIYERLGERYENYFIDEFQDTSTLQWNNLIPLISHALESENEKGHSGSLFLVGDVKQSIYRWRGGEPEQFLNLVFQHHNPFMIEPNVEQLPKNWRSHEEIIKFNNSFFTFIASRLSNSEFVKIYLEGNQQETNEKKGGVVSISFISKQAEGSNGEHAHSIKTLEIIEKITAAGYSLSDICILVRSRKEGVEVADYLQQHGLPLISSEALLLANNEEVQFIISIFKVLLNPNDREEAFNVLEYLTPNEITSHDSIRKNLNRLPDFLMEEYEIDLDRLQSLNLIDCAQKLILTFGLASQSNTFINFFVDVLFEFENKQKGTLGEFLDYWSLNESKLAVTSNEGGNAIQIMTIHKAKGLEFPFVIFPFADSIVNDSRKQNDIWFSVEPESHSGFSELLVTNNKYMEHYSEFSKNAFLEENQKSELDDFNVLYVALTRAIYGLFVISTAPSKRSSAKRNSYSSLFQEFLLDSNEFDDAKEEFFFGSLESNAFQKAEEDHAQLLEFDGRSFAEEALEVSISQTSLGNSDIAESIEFGNLVHQALSKVYAEKDIDNAVQDLLAEGKVSKKESQNLREILFKVTDHKDLDMYFKEGVESKNEVDILLEDGSLLRPDKIIFNEGSATLIDYKTGAASASHQKQLEDYASCLRKMGLKVDHKILVYINDDINTLAF